MNCALPGLVALPEGRADTVLDSVVGELPPATVGNCGTCVAIGVAPEAVPKAEPEAGAVAMAGAGAGLPAASMTLDDCVTSATCGTV